MTHQTKPIIPVFIKTLPMMKTLQFSFKPSTCLNQLCLDQTQKQRKTPTKSSSVRSRNTSQHKYCETRFTSGGATLLSLLPNMFTMLLCGACLTKEKLQPSPPQ